MLCFVIILYYIIYKKCKILKSNVIKLTKVILI